MEDLPERPSGGTGKKIGQSLRAALKRGWGVYGSAAERMGVMPKKIPAEQIDKHTVAKVIIEDIWAEGARLGDRTNLPISPSTLLDNMGHMVVSGSADY